MKSYHVNAGDSLSGLKIVETKEIPLPGPDEVVVRMKANSINTRDLMIMNGDFHFPVKPEVIPLSDGSGLMTGIGTNVTRFQIGDKVVASYFPHWTNGSIDGSTSAQLGSEVDGMLTEYAVLSEEAVVHAPDHLSFEEAATLPCTALAAWNAITVGEPLLAGHSVLTQGSGSVSLFAIQFAKAFGAHVISTTSSDQKAERLKELGADEVVNYRKTPNWDIAIRDLTEGQGVNRIIEVGGTGTLQKSIQSITLEGRIALVGRVSEEDVAIGNNVLSSSIYTLHRVVVGNRAQLTAMNKAIAVNQIKPVIDRVFSFQEAHDAFRYFAEQPHFGKVIIKH